MKDKELFRELHEHEEKHIIYTIKGKVKEAHKVWGFEKCEEILTRLGSEFWEIG
jgi:hypothetical protein